MTHGDNNGLVLPPRIAPVQVVVVPVAQHKEYLDGLAAAVAKCDSAACSYLTHIGNDADRSRVKTMYGNIMSMKMLWNMPMCELEYTGIIPHWVMY